MIRGEQNWVAAASRTIARYAYDDLRSLLYLQFRNGDVGYYAKVPRPVLDAFEAAHSKGTFIRQRLRNNPSFPWTAVSYPRRRRAPTQKQ